MRNVTDRFDLSRFQQEDGQAIVLVAVAMSIFLLGAVGLAVDGAHLYAQRQMEQTAADGAAVAGIMSIFDGTNTSGAAAFSTAPAGFSCTATDARTPCVYAAKNGFGGSGDTVTVDFPASTAAPGVSLSSDPTNLIRVTVARSVNTTLMRMLGPTASTVSATATAAIVSVVAPVPILVTDPTNPKALYINGNNKIKICGGPTQSIQVNSKNSAAYDAVNGTVDLSHAGPGDPGDCSAAAGASFGVFGGPTTNPGNVSTGSAKYLSPSSPIQDPLANVAAPTAPANNGTMAHIGQNVDGCKAAGGCDEYSPGKYASLSPGNNNVIFKPGLYYVQGGGVDLKQTVGGGGAPNYNAMCVGCAADAKTGTGMTIYDTVPAGTAAYPASQPTGGFSIGTLAQLSLLGPTNTVNDPNGNAVPDAPYYGVLFWEDRFADAHSGSGPTKNGNDHQIGVGNGCFTLVGTIYITNTLAIMNADSTHFQHVTFNGNPCSTTVNQGFIIVSQLELKGTTVLQMKLTPYGYLKVRQVALVN